MTLPTDDFVSNEPLRRAYLASGIPPSRIAKDMGWTARKKGRHGNGRVYRAGDTSRARKALGISPDKGHFNKRMRKDVAARMAELLHLDPVDIGL